MDELVRMVRGQLDPTRESTWQVEISGGVMEFRTFPERANVLDGRDHAREFTLLQALGASLRGPGEDRPLVMEVSSDGSGGWTFRHAFAASAAAVNTVVLDSDYRHPGHPRPGMPRTGAAAPTDEPTDPSVLAHVAGLVARFTEHYQRLSGEAPEFGEARTEADLVAAEREMGLRLPEDVRALYRLIGDDRNETGLMGRYSLLSLEGVASEYLEGQPGAWGWDEDLFGLNRVVLEADPPGLVRRVSRNDWWVVVASDFGGNYCALDLDPGPGGRPGQLLVYGRDYHGPVGYIAESVTARMEAVLAELDAGEVEWDGYPDISLPDGDDPYNASERVGDRDLADVLREIPHRDTVQQLYLNDAETLDLSALTATPRVRELRINRAGHVDLRLPDTVEGLKLDARHADLSVLSGHPALWDLTVKDLPVRVADLARLPALSSLDLSETEVDDVPALADLGIRALTLNADQWAQLRAAGRLPKDLAAARRAGKARVAELVDWSGWVMSAR
ncbi:hypothetical protein A6A25_18155 [Saccharothrix sp. CB00851]|nr:hypothetical protein A6A25_18155 [Saccharothrix sp. CB00851]